MGFACDIWSTSKSGGCAAKLSPVVLRDLCGAIAPQRHRNLLVGIETSDDAAIYKLTDQVALVQTLDFITPVVNDPYLFGQVAAANALSDVWAMGGRPLTAMNICCFPARGVDIATLGRILQGGLSKIEEAGAVLVGGHTVRDDELKYGLSITGLVHPENYTPNSGARSGDRLILTKPVGSGVHITGARHGFLSTDRLHRVMETLALLNKVACETMMEFDVRGATDVTGFGLGGHALEMAEASRVGIRFFFDHLPLFPDTLPLIDKGLTTSVTANNEMLLSGRVRYDPSLSPAERAVLSDPQTSGGLLIAIRETDAQGLLHALHNRGITDAAVIGEAFSANAPELHVVRA